MTSAGIAGLVLAVHIAVIAFNLVGLIAIVLGAALGWPWVRVRWWRALHLFSWAVVAIQAALGRACVLTLWEDSLRGQGGQSPLITRVVDRLIYWPLPIWVFSAVYLVMFAAVVVLWRVSPPMGRRQWKAEAARAKARP
jgi:hypothetical protein